MLRSSCSPQEFTGQGFTLIEVLIALMMLAVVFLGLSALTIAVSTGLSSSHTVTTAITLAQDRIEEIKNGGYAQATAANYPTEDYHTIPGYPQFRRTVTITTDSPIPNVKTVKVTVSWQGKGGRTREASLQTMISR